MILTVYECVDCGGSSVTHVPTPLAHYADCSADNIESVEYVRVESWKCEGCDLVYPSPLPAQDACTYCGHSLRPLVAPVPPVPVSEGDEK